jgi:hypothetical protein
MKLLLVFVSDETYELFVKNLRPLGFELIRYRHILKAMDNIDEIDPNGIIISASDFPRHWKTMIQFVKADPSRKSIPVIIMRGASLPVEETSKALSLEVSGIVSSKLGANEIDRIQNILGKVTPVEEKRRNKRFIPSEWTRLAFLFIHPDTGQIITGRLLSVSYTILIFLPDRPSFTHDIRPQSCLSECSLLAGDEILSPSCLVVRNNESITLEITGYREEAGADTLSAYLDQLPLEEYRNKRRKRIQEAS